MSDDTRIEALEQALAHQQRLVEDLNEVVTRQADEIAAMQRKLDALTQRFLAVEQAVQPDTPVDKPPHW